MLLCQLAAADEGGDDGSSHGQCLLKETGWVVDQHRPQVIGQRHTAESARHHADERNAHLHGREKVFRLFEQSYGNTRAPATLAR